MRLSKLLQEDTKQNIGRSADTNRRLPFEPQLESRYVAYLALLHAVVRASVPLMQSALLKCQGEKDRLLIRYLEKQIVEESDHDSWILEDVRHLNADYMDLFAQNPPDAIWNLVGSQYYIIQHLDKVGLLGYIAALETHPPDASAVYEVAMASGLPQKAFRTLVHHSHVDSSHVEFLDLTLDGLNLSLKQRDLIRQNAMRTAIGMRSILATKG